VNQRSSTPGTTDPTPARSTAEIRSPQLWDVPIFAAVQQRTRASIRPGAWTAMRWAIMPPTDRPTTDALGMDR
jgi:hypothetical protein